MKIRFVVPRFGASVLGGAERLARELATRLVPRGHAVEVLTTTARSYETWAPELPAGEAVESAVVVRRFPVDRPRRPAVFNRVHDRVLTGEGPAPYLLLSDWMRLQGPWSTPLHAALSRGRPDVTVALTYNYATTWHARYAHPLVLHPLAHDEPHLRLALFDLVFAAASALAFLTPEEADLVAGRSPPGTPSEVIGFGVDPPPGTNPDRFRQAFGLGTEPYLLCLGRVDPSKGTDELADFVATYRRRRTAAIRLVLAGDPVLPPRAGDVAVLTGPLDDQSKWDAMAGAVALVVPSYFESLSIALLEAWALGRPALVQGRTAVLVGQARRSEAALPYRGYAEFEAALDLLLDEPGLGRRLGASGLAYIERTGGWSAVIDRYEGLLERAAARAR